MMMGAKRLVKIRGCRMRKWVLGVAAVAILTVAGNAQRSGGGQQLSQKCRQEVMQLCGRTRDRDAIGQCLREKVSKLSSGCKSEIMQRIEARGGGRQTQNAIAGGAELSYGTDDKQRLDFWRAPESQKNPGLIVFIHGGGWSKGDKTTGAGTKPAFYKGLGYSFASLNYRLVPNATVDQQASDIATAIAALRRDAERFGFDGNNIVIMGHSAGAHLAALVSSDTRYLDQAGVPVTSIKATILLDGAGYDVVKQMASADNRVEDMYQAAFTNDPATQKALSPLTHVGGTDVGRWLFIYDDSRMDAAEQASELSNALQAAGVSSTVKAAPESTHMSINRDAGVAESYVGSAIAMFLKG
jgi:arylformamidase